MIITHLVLASGLLMQPGQGAPQTKQAKDQERFQREIDEDKKMGKEASDYYDRELRPTKDLDSQLRVERIGARLAAVANSRGFDTTWGDKRHAQFEYKFKVVDGKDINAFSLPGGSIYVYQGLVDFVQSDDELAGVLAHEICHASQRHIAWIRREQEKLAPIQIPLILASIFSGGSNGAAGIAGSQLIGTAATNGWSVKAETSADLGGAQLTVATGYDATGMLTFMERLQAAQGALTGSIDLGIFKTHPPSSARARKIEEFMQKNNLLIRRSVVAYDFRANYVAEDSGDVTLFFGKRPLFKIGGPNKLERAKSLTGTLNEYFDRVPEMYEVTAGQDGAVYAKNRTLISLTTADAAANSMTLPDLQEHAAKRIRASLFSLAYHIWEGRG
ncbi:MAG TPA: M48 family metalloprotease [Fimbriimonas sp.]|nr:M48 family metalloprotease [Fimbriimonas sp.]